MHPTQAPIRQADDIALESTVLDPLAYLPCSPIGEFGQGQAIYTPYQQSTKIYLVVQGRVKISRQADGSEVVVDIYQADEFFGESALAGPELRMEMAVALERSRIMSWSREEIVDCASLRPQLAMGLLQLMVRRSMDFGSRIESFSVESTGRRLRRSLIRFAERFGSETEDGSVRMAALTHELLSQYVGTSREIVTHYMSQYRREGYLQYSREAISLGPRALVEWQGTQPTAA
jgi:CRP/FNR family cyclic AMP-dependent transcriptional regulator